VKKKILIIVIAVVAAALTIAFIIHKPSSEAGKRAGKTIASGNPEKEKGAGQAKKSFRKGMGGISVSIKNSSGKTQYLRLKAFSVEGKRSSSFAATFGSGRMQELPPGKYDIEIDTVPALIYKNIEVKEGVETVEDLGAITGALTVKALNSKKKETPLPVKIIRAKSDIAVAVITTNRPAEIMPGIYDIDIETMPKQSKSDVKIESGKETVVDMGVVSGSVTVKAVDENGKEARLNVRIKNAANNVIAASAITGRPVEITPGEYDIEILSSPSQARKGVKVTAGEDTVIDFSIQSTPPRPAAPARKR